MKKRIVCFLLLALFLSGCGQEAPVTSVPATTVPETTVPETTVPETTVPETTLPPHSGLYLEGCSVDDLLLYWDEMVLDVEYSTGEGDFTLVQKWLQPIVYRVEGSPTEEDLRVLASFTEQLNRIPGFPGIQEADPGQGFNLTLSFLGPDRFRQEFSDVVQGEDAWGAVQFWYYTDTNEIYDARIGYRTDIPQAERSSIILEEIVNGLGTNDSLLREDSIVYQHSNDNLCLSGIDWLILELMYHPEMKCGMDREQSHSIIKSLYF